MRTIEANERSTVELPLSDLLGEGGDLKVRRDVTDRGLVEVAYVRGTLKLRIHGVVGYLPITDRIILDIKPKFSVSNLNRLVYSARTPIFRHLSRPYRMFVSPAYLPVPLIRSFTVVLKELIENGIVRTYDRETIVDIPRPRIDFLKSQQRFWARYDLTKAVVEKFSFSQDILPNQCLKLAAMKALSIAKSSLHLKDCVPLLARSLRQMVRISVEHPTVLIHKMSQEQRKLPSGRRDYVVALEQAVELIRHSDVSLNPVRTGSLLESYVVTLDDVFERYIRNVISVLPDLGAGRISTVDGNFKRHQKALFRDNTRHRIKPDLIMKDGSGIRMIGDVKYRIKPHEDDRYQIIAHALSYETYKAVLVYPKPDSVEHAQVRRLGTIGAKDRGIVVYEYFFDLSGCLEQQEELFRDAVVELLSL